jgi:protein FAM50
MGLDGYVGTAEDARRIMRQEKQREEQRKKYEALKKQSDANVDAAGLRQFGSAKTEVQSLPFRVFFYEGLLRPYV